MTEYIILRNYDCSDLNPPDYCWQIIGEPVKASSAGRAIAASLDKGGSAGEYVAVPSRSWRPLTVKMEQVTKVTIG